MAAVKKEITTYSEPSADVRHRVEASMLVMINHLVQQGLHHAEIAIALADAADSYVMDLANGTGHHPVKDR